MFNIDSASTDIGVYSLNTVGTSGSLSVNGAVVIQAAPLQNGLSNVRILLHPAYHTRLTTPTTDRDGLDLQLNKSLLLTRLDPTG